MRNETRPPRDTIVRVHGEPGSGIFPILVVAARPPHEAVPGALAAALTTFGTAAIFRGFYDDEPCADHHVDHVADFLNMHRGGIAVLGFARENAAARCVRLLKGRSR